jgi:hypothetical protein
VLIPPTTIAEVENADVSREDRQPQGCFEQESIRHAQGPRERRAPARSLRLPGVWQEVFASRFAWSAQTSRSRRPRPLAPNHSYDEQQAWGGQQNDEYTHGSEGAC